MNRLTMQEVIEHCERTVEKIEKVHERYPNWLELEPMPISVKRYWEHKQTAEWLKELQHYKDLEEQGRLKKIIRCEDCKYCYHHKDFDEYLCKVLGRVVAPWDYCRDAEANTEVTDEV